MTTIQLKDGRSIQLVDGGGRGSHSTIEMFVDGRRWASIAYVGRSGWEVCDAQGHRLFHRDSKAWAAQDMQRAYEAGEIPDPDKAWRNSVERVIAVEPGPLLQSVQEFVALARENPALAGSNSFRRMVDEAIAIYRAPLKKFEQNIEHADHFLRQAEESIKAPYIKELEQQARQHRETELRRSQRRAEDAHARLAYAEAQIKAKLIRLGLIDAKEKVS